MNRIRILAIHNRYIYPGGEDQVFQNETHLLELKGHLVTRYVEDNKKIPNLSPLQVALGSFWSVNTYRNVRRLLKTGSYDLLHIHNFFPLVSPSVYYAARFAGVPVIQTLHNFRLMCCNALFFRNGSICEACLTKKIGWPGIRFGCYRKSYLQSAVASLSFAMHRFLGTWNNMIDRYIVLTDFSKSKFISAGLPFKKIIVKPNFLSNDPGENDKPGRYALYIGRLSAEKGIDTLLNAWHDLHRIPLKIAGDGPLKSKILKAVDLNPNIEYLGSLPHSTAIQLIRDARFIVVPSEWYEHFPMVVVESFACGRPVIASQIGSLAKIVNHGISGYLFSPGNNKDLALNALKLWDSKYLCRKFGAKARSLFKKKYSMEPNYQQLKSVYSSLIDTT